MKNKLIYTILIGCIYFIPEISISQNNIDKDKIYKTWHITEAFEIKVDKTKNNKTEKTKGSTFTFNSNRSIIITNGIENYSKGIWTEVGENSISIAMSGAVLNFKIKELTDNNLYLIGKGIEKSNLEIHIIFGSISEKIKQNKEQNFNALWSIIEKEETNEQTKLKNVELKTLRNTPGYVNSFNKLKKLGYENLIENYWNLKSIKIDNNGKVDIYSDMKLNFNFKKNNKLEIIEDNIKKNATWEVVNQRVLLTTNDKTTTFTIDEISSNNLILKKTNKNFSIYYNLYH